MSLARRVLVDDAELAVHVDGADTAPPVLLLNSIGTDVRVWSLQVAAFSAHFRVVRYDYPGHGESGPASAAQTLEGLGRHAVAVLDALALRRAHLCGLSLGGQVALWLAATHGDRVDRAVFAATAARIGTSDLWDARISAALMGGMHLIRAAVLQRFFGAAARRDYPERVAAVREMLETATPTGYASACAALRDADLSAVLADIRARSLIVAGRHDVSTPLEQLEALETRIAGSTLAVLEAAHLVNVEAPDEFARVVLEFLAAP